MKFLLDENTHGTLAKAIRRWNETSSIQIDAVRVGDADAPDYATPDDELLIWAMNKGRILVSRDFDTMPTHLKNHLALGFSSPGVVFLAPSITMAEAVEALATIVHAGCPEDYFNRIDWIPLKPAPRS